MSFIFRNNKLSVQNKIFRILWTITWTVFFRPTPRSFHSWRSFLLRLFGAKIGRYVHPYPSAKVWAPWNLEMGDYSCLSEAVDCYCVDKIIIGERAIVSQYSFLCTASHDYNLKNHSMQLITAPIIIGSDAWITSDVFIAPGVVIGKGAVVLARSSVFNDIPEWTISKGSPAKPFKDRDKF